MPMILRKSLKNHMRMILRKSRKKHTQMILQNQKNCQTAALGMKNMMIWTK